ncbi:hypothetical protein Tco_1311150 [Tanacetum coccineum]
MKGRLWSWMELVLALQITQTVDKVDKSILSWRGRKSLIVVDWCDLKSISENVFSKVEPFLIQLTLVNPVGSVIANSIPELLNIDSGYCRRGGKCSEEVVTFPYCATANSITKLLQGGIYRSSTYQLSIFYSSEDTYLLMKSRRGLQGVNWLKQWALTTIINMCLTGKTSGFERPRAPVLQILWGVINRVILIMRKERCWKNSLNPFFLTGRTTRIWHHITQGKKKATLIVIPSVRFTKLIIFHLQRKHKFHPRPESPLHLPTEEPIMGYLKFSAKGTKREVFGMPIPNELITDDIRGADYYDAYLEKVAKHQRYLAGEEVTPTKPKEKKRKKAKETTEATPPTKRAKAGKVVKKRTLKSSQQLVDEFVDEGFPLTERGFGDLEADTQRAIKESLKDAHE